MPDVYWNLTAERVVTMEYVPGVKINNLEEIESRGIDRKVLAKRSAEAYLTQLCRHGFFHCDPHPGMYCPGLTSRPPRAPTTPSAWRPLGVLCSGQPGARKPARARWVTRYIRCLERSRDSLHRGLRFFE